MARLTWGAPDERFFGSGIDRGVLFVGDNDGVPWNGLIAVTESPTGGEAKPAYLDGVKFRNRSSPEEFEATIEAFCSPIEFDICDGTRMLQNGLRATQQPRVPFHFSYRTKVGNAADGIEHAYQIHLVYNALAAPSSRTRNTLGDSSEADSLSWALTTRPSTFPGIKPTSHFMIDSREASAAILLDLENTLYGSEIAPSRMLNPSEMALQFSALSVTEVNGVMTITGSDSEVTPLSNGQQYSITSLGVIPNPDQSFVLNWVT